MMSFLKARSVLAVLTALTALLVACGDDESDAASSAQRFAGRVQGTDALIALVYEGANVNGYLCDGNEGKGELSEWFVASGSGDPIAFVATSRNGIKISGTTKPGGIEGTVTFVDGSEKSFSASPATDDAGLYRASAKDSGGHNLVAGWILLEDGTQRGYVEQDNIRVRTTKLDRNQITDGTSNITDGTSNTVLQATLVTAPFRTP
jgi:hypothetical protein